MFAMIFPRPDLVPNTVRHMGLAGVAQRKFEQFANWGGMKPSSVLKYSGWGIVDSPSESPRQTADFFFYLNQFLLFQGSYVYGHNNHGLLQLHVIMFQKK